MLGFVEDQLVGSRCSLTRRKVYFFENLHADLKCIVENKKALKFLHFILYSLFWT
jgi:hypothetical protein